MHVRTTARQMSWLSATLFNMTHRRATSTSGRGMKEKLSKSNKQKTHARNETVATHPEPSRGLQRLCHLFRWPRHILCLNMWLSNLVTCLYASYHMSLNSWLTLVIICFLFLPLYWLTLLVMTHVRTDHVPRSINTMENKPGVPSLFYLVNSPLYGVTILKGFSALSVISKAVVTVTE